MHCFHVIFKSTNAPNSKFFHRYHDSPGVTQVIQVVENFGSDWRLLCKLHIIWSVDSQENQ